MVNHKELFERIIKHLDDDGVVQVSTYTKSTLYRRKHSTMFTSDSKGVYVKRGKNWDCISYCSIRFGRAV